MPLYQEFGVQIKKAIQEIALARHGGIVGSTGRANNELIQRGWSKSKIEDLKKGWVRGENADQENLTRVLLELGGFPNREDLIDFVNSYRHPYVQECVDELWPLSESTSADAPEAQSASAYDVSGLDNPYLGLEAYTESNWVKYAGREELADRIVAKLTSPGQERSLLFISGQSGSGKSSFAQAALVPNLEKHYKKNGKLVRYKVVEPSGIPTTAFIRDINWLGISGNEAFPDYADDNGGVPAQPVQPNEVCVLVIDQFEDYFLENENIGKFLDLLSNLPSFAKVPLHIIATLRLDHLPKLFQLNPSLHQIATQDMPSGDMPLGVMTVDELKRAIQRPLDAVDSNARKYFEPELLKRLAEDAAKDVARLPWLQFSLWDLWKRGRLMLDAYGGLEDAISRGADDVFYRTKKGVDRSEEDQALIMSIFRDLVDIDRSNEEYAIRYVCRRRPLEHVVKGDARRSELIEELVDQRLLSKDWVSDADQAVVRVIHDSLITEWSRLGEDLRRYAEQLEQRNTFIRRLKEWEELKSDDLLLDPIHLAQARQLLERGDVALRLPIAQEYLQKSIRHSERRLRNQRMITAVLTLLLMVSAVAIFIALRAGASERVQRIIAQDALELSNVRGTAVAEQAKAAENARVLAQQQAYLARSGELAAMSRIVLDRNEDSTGALPLLLGREAIMTAQHVYTDATTMSVGALDSALAATPLWKATLPVAQHSGTVYSVAFSPTGDRLASAGADGFIRIWDMNTGEQILVLVGHTNEVRSVAWNSTGDRVVTASTDRTVRVWDALSGGPALLTIQYEANALYAAWSYSGRYLLITGDDNKIRIWDLQNSKFSSEFSGHTALVYSATWSSDDKYIVSASWDHTARIWSVEDGSFISLVGHDDAVFTAAFSNDSKYVVTASSDHTARIWDATGKEVIALSGHSGNVYAASFSPDGTQVITASDDKSVGIWEWAEGTDPQFQQLLGYEDPVLSAVWRPGGKFVATSDLKGTIRIWDVEKKQELPLIQGHHTWVMSAAWSPDGSKILSTSADHTTRIWDAVTGRQLQVLQGYDREVWTGAWGPNNEIITGGDDGAIVVWNSDTAIAETHLYTSSGWIRTVKYSPDQKMVAAAEADGTIRVWDVATDDEMTQIESGQAWPTAIDWSPDAQYLVVGFGCDPNAKPCPNQAAKIIARQSNSTPIVLRGHRGAIISVAWSPDGKQIITGGTDGTVRLWNALGGDQVDVFIGHVGEVRAVAWHPSSQLFASAGADHSVRIWDSLTSTNSNVLLGHTAAVNSVAWHPSGKYLLTASNDRTVRIWYAQDPQIVHLLDSEGIRSGDFSPDGTRLLFSGTDKAVYLWNLEQGAVELRLGGFSRSVLSAEFDPTGTRIVTASGEPWARIWYLSQPDSSIRLVGHNGPVNYATWNHDGRYVATAGEDSTARIWNSQTGQEVLILRGHQFAVQQVAFNQDSTRIVTASADRTVRVWDATTGEQLLMLDGHSDGVMTAAFNHEGTQIATAGRDTVIRIWDANTGSYLFSLEGHTDDILFLEWNSDDKYLISASMDNSARVWNVASGEEVRLLQGHTGTVTSASWGPNGRWIVTSSLDGTARLWPASTQQILETTTARIQRDPPEFTPEERVRFRLSD